MKNITICVTVIFKWTWSEKKINYTKKIRVNFITIDEDLEIGNRFKWWSWLIWGYLEDIGNGSYI
jgi:hypothetical protein